mgnify:CR=1 FL=1
MSYKVDKTFTLGVNEGSSQRAKNWYIIAHETANATATGRNEATYMKRNWRAAYTHYIVGDGKVYQVGEPGYVAYGALNANPYSPVQIELQHSDALFSKNYPIYIELIRDSAKKYGIPLTLDTGKHGTKGVKSHKWVSDNIGGDHQDPYSFLAKHGISKAQFAKDIANGVGKKPVVAKPATNTFNIKNYHTTVPSQIKVIKADYAYKDKALKTKVGAKVPTNTILTVTGIEYSGKYPRFKLKSGLYITTRKDTVSIHKAKTTTTGYTAKKVGQTVTVQNKATKWQTGQAIPKWVHGQKYKIIQVKSVNQSNSKRAYLLDKVTSWILEQDVK